MLKSRTQDNFRWFILGLLFIATTILYIDRSALGILAPDLQKSIGWSEEQYGYINTAFMIAYAICFMIMGTIIDRIGTKKGYMISIGIWSLATAAHSLAGRWIGFAIARFALAAGQSGNFPSAIKAVAEWFPKKERALAVSIFNGGANMGTILSPLIIPGLVLMAGSWRVAFLWTVPISLLWLILWSRNFKKPENHKKVSEKELSYINSDSGLETGDERMSWKDILPHRGTWAIAVGKFPLFSADNGGLVREVLRYDPVQRNVRKGGLAPPAGGRVDAENEALDALRHLPLGEIVGLYEGGKIGIEAREGLGPRPFVLHDPEKIDDLLD